jgi:RNA polymerase sigma-70 factor, ECF subfamily
MTDAEDDLVDRAVSGDRDAVEQLVAGVYPMVVRYCRARIGPNLGTFATADDVAQDVCLAVVQALPRFRVEGRPFAAFVYAVAAHKVADAARAARRVPLVTPLAVLADTPDSTPGPEPRALANDLATRMQRLLSHLPPLQREIVVLRVVVGMRAEEVAVLLDMTAGAVRLAQHRALAKLRALAPALLDEVAR